MKTFDELYIKRKVYVSTVGWVSSIFAGLIIYFSIFGIINLLLFQQNPMIQDFSVNESSDVSQFFDKTYQLLFIIFGLSTILGLIFLISSIGLIKNKHWGRRIFVLIGWILIFTSVIAIATYVAFSGSILSQIVNGNIPNHEYGGMTEFMKKMIGLKIVGFGILLVIFIRTLFQIVRRLNMDIYKSLFS